jgi:flagellar motor switch protein FliN/FliY
MREGQKLVTKTTSLPYDWLKEIPTSLLQLDEIPLFGFPPAFPWNDLSKGLGELFQIQDLKIQSTPFQWVSQDKLYSTLGEAYTPINFTIPSMEGNLSWVMANEDMQRLMSFILNDKHHQHDALEDEFMKGFYHFLAYEIIHVITKLPFGSDLSPQVQKESKLIDEDALCSDLSIDLRGKTLTGRLIISQDLRRSWKEKYAERSLEIPLQSSVASKLTIPVHLEAGKTSISPSDWQKVNVGDFILLDSCTVNPQDEKGGRVTLTVNGIPFFIAKLKEGNLKILEHPLYHSEDIDMSSKNPNDQTDEHEDSSFDFDTEDSAMDSEIEESGFEDSEMESEVEDSEFESEVENSELESEVEDSELKTEDSSVQDETEEAVEVVKQQTSLNINEVPLSVIVEVGRLQMSVQKILELQPGNLLELNIHPENGVDLVVNGKRIAKAELVKLGETLGVRILDIN